MLMVSEVLMSFKYVSLTKKGAAIEGLHDVSYIFHSKIRIRILFI